VQHVFLIYFGVGGNPKYEICFFLVGTVEVNALA